MAARFIPLPSARVEGFGGGLTLGLGSVFHLKLSDQVAEEGSILPASQNLPCCFIGSLGKPVRC